MIAGLNIHHVELHTVIHDPALVGSVEEFCAPTFRAALRTRRLRDAAVQRGPHGVLCHAWMWWVTEDRRLSKKAAAPIQAAIAKGGVWLPAIAIWEIAKKAEKRKLVFDRPVRQWTLW